MHFENIPWGLANFKSDSQLEMWELHGEYIRPSLTSLEVPNIHVISSVPHGERRETDNRFQKINDRFLRQNCFPNKLALLETIWWQLWEIPKVHELADPCTGFWQQPGSGCFQISDSSPSSVYSLTGFGKVLKSNPFRAFRGSLTTV